jgi:hypothetical protein
MIPTRTESFVPLTSNPPRPAGERGAFQATVITQAGVTQKLPAIAVPAAVPQAAAAAPQPKGTCEPKVSVQRDGTRVTGIQVLCSCGEVIDLTCVYDAVAPQAAAAPAAAPKPATTPQAKPEVAPAKGKPGKICKDSRKDLPASAAKKPKVPEKGRGTSAAKRRSA